MIRAGAAILLVMLALSGCAVVRDGTTCLFHAAQCN